MSKLVDRLKLPWPPYASEEVTLPVWVLELCAEAADRIEALEEQLAEALNRNQQIERMENVRERHDSLFRRVLSDPLVREVAKST